MSNEMMRSNPLRSAVAAAPTTPPDSQSAAWIETIRERVDAGIDPAYVGELVREGIEGDWPYIFTDTEFEPAIDARFAAIKQGFDKIRGRTPRR